jgi:MFS family permease
MAQGMPGFESDTNPELALIVTLLILLLGLLVAFAGRIVWKNVMSLIGALIGGTFGFVLGFAVGGILLGLFVGMLSAVICSFVFIFLAEIGLGFVAGMFTYIIADALLGNMIVALVLGAVAMTITIVFIQQAIGVVTAGIGGLLVGISLLWLDYFDMTVVVLSMFGVMILGAAFQLAVIAEGSRVVPTVHAASPAPETPAVPGRTCPNCGGSLTYVSEYNRYFCHRCQRYE